MSTLDRAPGVVYTWRKKMKERQLFVLAGKATMSRGCKSVREYNDRDVTLRRHQRDRTQKLCIGDQKRRNNWDASQSIEINRIFFWDPQS